MSQRRLGVIVAVLVLGVAQLIIFWLLLDGCLRPLVVVFVLIASAFAVSAANSVVSGRHNIARQQLVGLEGEVTRDLDPRGKVAIGNELWSAQSFSGETIPRGSSVVVRNKVGPLLQVEAKTGEDG